MPRSKRAKPITTFHPDAVDSEWFWQRVDQSGGPNACWPWTKALLRVGYGQFRAKGQQFAAHRVAWALTHGDIPAGLFICHHCDNRPCCNPAHLFIGTHQDNVQDAQCKGRIASGEHSGMRAHPESVLRGERNGYAKLTSADVSEIRAAYDAGEVQRELAKRYGVGAATIHRIVHGVTYQHLVV